MDDNTYINANDLLDAAKDHYWDSLEHERELIIKHIEGIISCLSHQSRMTTLPKMKNHYVTEWETMLVVLRKCEFCPYQDTCR
jgi:hypothetical protein